MVYIPFFSATSFLVDVWKMFLAYSYREYTLFSLLCHIFEGIFSGKERLKSHEKVGDDRRRELIYSEPFDLCMDIWLKVLRHTLPGIYEIEVSMLITIYIVCMDIYLRDDIILVDTYADLLSGLTCSCFSW